MAGAGFLEFARHVVAGKGQVLAAHHELLIRRLQEVEDGACDRLMVQMPPGSAKSTYGSILFPAYFLGGRRRRQVIATAHTASLAHYFGLQTRRVIEEFGGYLDVEITKESKASSRFSVKGEREYFSTGVRGPITGRRADLIIIDDPVKSWAEAESLTARNALFDWYRGELTARLKPGGRVVLIMTRWHEDDLAGRLLAAEQGWDCLRLPALAEEGDELGRAPGEALWPSWQDAKDVERRRREVGERAFAALYQQRPASRQERVFRTERIRILREAPEIERAIRAWDFAASLPMPGRDPDYTVGVKLGITAGNELVVLDVVRFRETPAGVEERVKLVARVDGAGVLVSLPQDPGQAGAAQVAMMKRALLGFRVEASAERDPKIVRAMLAATQIDAGNLLLKAGPWNDAFLAELKAFPEGGHDDQVDALSRAVNVLTMSIGQPARRVSLPYISR